MKAVTIGKIARLLIIVAVVVILAIPTIAGVESFKISGMDLVETGAVYELDCMTDNDLANNINNVTDGKSGYTIVAETKEGVKTSPVGVPTNSTDLRTLATDIKTNFVGGKATLLDADGNVAKQQTITGSDGLTQYVFTGIKLTGSLVNMVTPTVALESVIYDARTTISDVEMQKTDDSYRIKIKIPYILFATAIAAGENSKIGIAIGIEYNSFFDVKVRMDMPLSRFFDTASGGTIELPTYSVEKSTPESPITYQGTDHTYDGLQIQEQITVTAKDLTGLEKMSASIGSFGNTDGGIRLEVNDEGEIMVMSDKEDIIEAFESAREDDGSLIINLDDGSDPIVVESEQIDSLLSMVDELLEKYPEYRGLLI